MSDLKFLIPILIALTSIGFQLYSMGKRHGYEQRSREIEEETFDFEKENKST